MGWDMREGLLGWDAEVSRVRDVPGFASGGDVVGWFYLGRGAAFDRLVSRRGFYTRGGGNSLSNIPLTYRLFLHPTVYSPSLLFILLVRGPLPWSAAGILLSGNTHRYM